MDEVGEVANLIVSAKVTEQTIRQIEKIVKEKQYVSRSEFIRYAIRRLLEAQKKEEE